jgi:putative aldouronate transport system substrate-binding protein
MTSSDELPDIIEWEWTSSFTGGPAAAEDEGVLIWLDDYISPDGPAADLWQYLQDNPTLDQAVKTDDGHYYCFPFVRGSKYLQTTSGPIVRKDLLENLGFNLDDITTIADWTEMLTALKESGIEKPLTTQNFSNLQALTLGAYGVRAGMYLDYETGNVKYGYTEEGYKEWLKQMVEWVKAGLLDADILSNDSKTRQTNILGSISAVTYGAGGGQIGTWNSTAAKEPDTYGSFELTGIQFPVLNEGDEIHYYGGSTDYAISSSAHAVITQTVSILRLLQHS